MLKDLVKQCRSYRRFYQDTVIPYSELADMVDTARLAASASNAQALKFKILCTPEECAGIFPYTAWAGALKDWEGPEEGERPSAYIVIACDLSIGKNKQWDDGITAQTIMLAAAEKGYGGCMDGMCAGNSAIIGVCMIGSCMRSEIGRLLGLDPEHYSIDLVLALGKPKEEVVLVPVKEDGSTAYYRDGNQVHYVPKRSLEDILL